MTRGSVLARFAVLLLVSPIPPVQAYSPDWESLDSRPTPAWFTDAKFGIFIHWGVYSVPAWAPKDQYAEWYWHAMQDRTGPTWGFHESVYGAGFAYPDFASRFTAELFDPAEWAETLRRSGARYVVLTSKHHDGFALWPSAEAWNWNASDIGPHRDLLGDLTAAVRAKGLRMGYYYSLYEWFNPLYRSDPGRYVDEHMLPQMRDLVTRYRPDLLWGDGEWDHPSEFWKTPGFLAWLFTESNAPGDIAVNDRWGKDTRSRHGGFFTTEYGKHHAMEDSTAHPWEECRGMGMSFGYNRNEDAEDYRSTTELVHLLIETVSRGGNLLLDIGPTADGRIPAIMEERLLGIGAWIEVNGDAIYGTTPWHTREEGPRIRYLAKGDAVHAVCLDWPGEEMVLAAPQAAGKPTARLLGYPQNLEVRPVPAGLQIRIPNLTVDMLPCRHAYVFELRGVK